MREADASSVSKDDDKKALATPAVRRLAAENKVSFQFLSFIWVTKQ